MNPEFVGIRQFSQKLFRYLRSNHAIVLIKHGRPFRILEPITEKMAQSLKKQETITHLLSHKAVGLWKKRWISLKSSSVLAAKIRTQEENRFLK